MQLNYNYYIFWLQWISYNEHDFLKVFVHTFHGMEGIILAFGKVVMNDYHKFKRMHVVLIVNVLSFNYFSIIRGMMAPNVVMITSAIAITHTSNLTNGSGNVSGTSTKSGGVNLFISRHGFILTIILVVEFF